MLLPVIGPHRPAADQEEPRPEWVLGDCPACGGPLVCNLYYVGGKGYLTRVECWHSLGSHREPPCDYRRVL